MTKYIVKITLETTGHLSMEELIEIIHKEVRIGKIESLIAIRKRDVNKKCPECRGIKLTPAGVCQTCVGVGEWRKK